MVIRTPTAPFRRLPRPLSGLLLAATLTACGVPANPSASHASDAASDAAAKAKDILSTKCAPCHGNDGSHAGGIDYISDLKKLVDAHLVVPASGATSPLLKAVKAGKMPKAPRPPLPQDEQDALSAWIDLGAPAAP